MADIFCATKGLLADCDTSILVGLETCMMYSFRDWLNS